MNSVNVSLPYWLWAMIFIVLIITLSKLITTLIQALLKFIIVWKRGFPPPHCDALGDTWDEELPLDRDINILSNISFGGKPSEEEIDRKVKESLVKAVKESEVSNG